MFSTDQDQNQKTSLVPVENACVMAAQTHGDTETVQYKIYPKKSVEKPQYEKHYESGFGEWHSLSHKEERLRRQMDTSTEWQHNFRGVFQYFILV